jgi:uncharacterized protein (TIGR00106 family)
MVLLEFSMSPLGIGESVSKYVTRSLDIIDKSGLDYEFHSMGTVIEGEWGEVMDVVKKCFETMSADCNRISVAMKIDYRKGAKGRISGKIKSVEDRLGRDLRKGKK